MPQITINRVSGFSNKIRRIKLFMDNKEIDEIGDGEIKTIHVNAGKHILKAKIDWCQSNEIELNVIEGETKEVKLRGTNPFLALYYITFGRNNYLKLES